MAALALASKVAIITGAGRGIGLAASKLFIANGAKVFLSDLDLKEAREELKDHGSEVVGFLEADVTSEESVAAMCKAATAQFGKLDVAILNAGVFSGVKPWIETDASEVDFQNAVNVRGSWITAKHAVKSMIASPAGGKGCSLVFVASVASLYGQPGMAAYVASKWAVRGLSLTAAAEFAQYGIRANVIQPGATATAMFAKFPEELQTAVKASNVMNRAAEPIEIAEAMLFLASDKSSFMTGSTIAVHAGQTPT